MIPLLLLFSALIFALIHLTPGDPANFFLPQDQTDPQLRARVLARLQLDQPLPVQYFAWASGLVRGDLGYSWTYDQPVLGVVMERFTASLQLWVPALLLALLVAVPVGVVSAVRKGSWVDHGATVLTLCGISLPDFWLALMLLMLFSLGLRWLPAAGDGQSVDAVHRLPYFVLPVIVLSAPLIPFYSRLLRASLFEVLTTDYVRTARSKGLPRALVLSRHSLRNALLPLATIVGFSAARLVGASVIVESVFAWPGLGRLALDASLRRDYPLVMGVVVLTFLVVMLINLLVDVGYMLLDPRIRFSRAR
jgi:peptide/nickel transport system permease protein